MLLQLVRALKMFSTGAYVLPEGTVGMFSRNNWDDGHRIDDTGSPQVVKRASKLHAIFAKLSDAKWKRVAAAARLQTGRRWAIGAQTVDENGNESEGDIVFSE